MATKTTAQSQLQRTPKQPFLPDACAQRKKDNAGYAQSDALEQLDKKMPGLIEDALIQHPAYQHTGQQSVPASFGQLDPQALACRKKDWIQSPALQHGMNQPAQASESQQGNKPKDRQHDPGIAQA
jgi:hypothetical protein